MISGCIFFFFFFFNDTATTEIYTLSLHDALPISWLITQFFRNAPWLVLLFYCILLMPFEVRIGGAIVPLPGWAKSTAGLALPVMANVAELLRGAVQSIPSGQWEAAEAL